MKNATHRMNTMCQRTFNFAAPSNSSSIKEFRSADVVVASTVTFPIVVVLETIVVVLETIVVVIETVVAGRSVL